MVSSHTASTPYESSEPARSEIDALQGPALVEFGSAGCGWCRAAEPLVREALAAHPRVRHIRIEDGSGRPLGRSFGVKLWPTLVFMNGGQELARLVRPHDSEAVARALSTIDA